MSSPTREKVAKVWKDLRMVEYMKPHTIDRMYKPNGSIVKYNEFKSKWVFKVKATGAFYAKVQMKNDVWFRTYFADAKGTKLDEVTTKPPVKYHWVCINWHDFLRSKKPPMYMNKQAMQQLKKQKKLVKATYTELAGFRVRGVI